MTTYEPVSQIQRKFIFSTLRFLAPISKVSLGHDGVLFCHKLYDTHVHHSRNIILENTHSQVSPQIQTITSIIGHVTKVILAGSPEAVE